MNIVLTRFAYLDYCTLGELSVDGLLLKTIERPWIRNHIGDGGMPDKSCVPDGAYTVTPHNTPSKPDTYQLVSYPLGVYEHTLPASQDWGRTEVLIHIANRVEELLGCVAVGLKHFHDGKEYSVLQSKDAMDLLRQKLQKGKHYLIVQPTKGTV